MSISNILSGLGSNRDTREALYKHFHRNPELSLQEYKTAERVESALKSYGIEEILRIGSTGIVAVLRNGDGRDVLRRVPNYEMTRRKMFDTVLRRLTDPTAPICDTGIAILHTELIESIHRAGKVAPISSSAIEYAALTDNGSQVPAIARIEDRLESAYQTLSALGETEATEAPR